MQDKLSVVVELARETLELFEVRHSVRERRVQHNRRETLIKRAQAIVRHDLPKFRYRARMFEVLPMTKSALYLS